MEIWDLATLTLEPQRPEVLHSDEGRLLVHRSPQKRHAVGATEDALLLRLLAPWPGPGHPSLRG